MKKYYKQTISILLITVMFVLPFSSLNIKKAEADNSVASYIKSLAPVIAKMPGCQKAIGTGVSDLFKKVKDLFSSKGSGDLSFKASDYDSSDTGGDDTVQVLDAKSREELAKANAKLDEAKKAQDNMDKNQNCLNGIGKAIAKVLINKSTDSIINWVNTGDAGGPLFVQDPGTFFKDIAEDEILGFGAEIRDPELYPFGKDFMKMQANSYKSKFANNAKYSLNEVIQNSNPNYSDQTFTQDFSQGGWGAWDALTQNSANNPLGFSIMASNELAKRIEEKTSLAEGSLQMGSGFLGVQKCLDPEGVTKSQDELGREERRASPDLIGPYENPICNKWIEVTPGKFVGDQLVSAVQKKDNALLDVATLNDAMAAILDAVLAKFTNTLQTEGIANLEQPTNDEYYRIDQQAGGIGNFQNEADFSKAQINASTWLKDNPDFNIRTDLNQALIDEQRIYSDKIEEQNKELFSLMPPTAENPLGNYGLVPTIYQLDYCIPGPHPGWEEDTANNFEEAKNTIIDTTGMNFQQIYSAYGGTLMSENVGLDIYLGIQALPFVGGSVTGPEQIDNYVQMWFGTGDRNCGGEISITGCVNTKLNTKTLEKFTHIIATNHIVKFEDTESIIGVLDRIYDGYVKAMNNVYIPEVLPSVAGEAKTLFEKIPKYNKIYNGNKKTMDTITASVARLTQLKNEIDLLNNELITGDFTKSGGPDLTSGSDDEKLAEYEKELTQWKLAFVRISYGMYSGDDIATVHDLTKQLVDERDYVLKNLIKSKTGCEAEVAASNSVTKEEDAKMSWKLSGGKELDRPDYPMPHLYDYPLLATTDINKPIKGFLWYTGYGNWGGGVNPKVRQLCTFYEKFGMSNMSDCIGNKGPNFIQVADLLGPTQEMTLSSTKTLGGDNGNFERDVLKAW